MTIKWSLFYLNTQFIVSETYFCFHPHTCIVLIVVIIVYIQFSICFFIPPHGILSKFFFFIYSCTAFVFLPWRK